MSSRFEIEIEGDPTGFPLALSLASDARALGVFGPSGAGKTSLLETVAGWRRPRRGRIAIGGRVLFDSAQRVDVPAAERGIGYVPQDLLLFPHWSAGENVRAGRGRGRAPDAARARALFERTVDVLELGDLLDRAVHHLSGGEQQRVALARALCSDPDLLVLDEPLASLDRELRERILPYLMRVQREFGLPLIAVSHEATELQALCGDIALLDRGRATACGPAAATLFRNSADPARLENLLSGTVARADGRRVEVALGGGLALAVAGDPRLLGRSATVAVRAGDLLLATEHGRGLSARNDLPGRIAALHERDFDLLVELTLGDAAAARPAQPTVFSLVTREAAADLALAPGRSIRVLFKAHSCRVLEA